MTTTFYKEQEKENNNIPLANLFYHMHIKNALCKMYPELIDYEFIGIERYTYDNDFGRSMQHKGIDLKLIFKNIQTGKYIEKTVEEKVDNSWGVNLEITNWDKINDCPKEGWAITFSSELLIIFKPEKIYILKNFNFMKSICMSWYKQWESLCGEQPFGLEMKTPQIKYLTTMQKLLSNRTAANNKNGYYWTSYTTVSEPFINKYMRCEMVICQGTNFYKELANTPYINLYKK